MRPDSFDTRPGSPLPRLALAIASALVAVCAALALTSPVGATIADKQEQLDQVRAQKADVQEELAASNEQINGLIAQVSEAREREEAAAAELAAVEARLDEATAELEEGRDHLEDVREQLRRAVNELEDVLVGIYKAGDAEAIRLLIESSGWDDEDVDAAYLDRLQDYQSDVVQRVEDLRDEAEATVARLAETKAEIEESRDEVAARQQALAQERAALEAQEAELAAAREARRQTLSRLAGREVELQDGIEAAQQRIARENAAAVPPPVEEATDDSVAAPPVSAPAPGNGSTATLNSDGTATPPADAPAEVVAVIEAANRIKDMPYVWGGGHGSFEDSGYDCSGAVSYALHGGGFLSSPLDSTGLSYWGEAGPGNWITVYANSGHTYAVIAGLRWDTSGTGGSGPGWSTSLDGYLDTSSYTARHPAGF